MKVLSLPLLLLVPTAAADVSLFVGQPGGRGDVQVHDETGGAPGATVPGLAGVELLPIEVAGRTRLTEFLPDRARRIAVGTTAARLSLPGGLGSLYRFRRDEAGGAAAYGFFLVGRDGAARVLIERDGTGAGDGDPFVDRVAVAPGGESFLAATVPAAGGDLFEVGVDGSVQSRTLDEAPLEVQGAGLMLGATWGTAAGPAGAVRFDRAPGAQAEGVPFPAAPTWFGGELVRSPDTGHAATTAGSAPESAFVYVWSATGSAARASASPAPLTGAGFLPEHLAGPFLAVQDGGETVAWRTEDNLVREAWLGRVAAADVQLTTDQLYLETMDQAGVMRFLPGGGLLLAVGEAPELGEEGIERMDLYRVDTEATGAPAIQNLSQSNGIAQPPFFDASEIDPEYGLHAVPGTSWILFHNSDSSSGELLAVDTAAGTRKTVLPDVKSLDLVEMAAGQIAVSVRRDATDRRQLVRLDAATLTPTILVSMSDEGDFTRSAIRPDGALGVVVELFGDEWIGRVDLETLQGGLLLAAPLLGFGPVTGFTPTGALFFTAGLPGLPAWAVAWSDGGGVSLPLDVPFEGHVLPGA